ncbi:hypothetical protein E1B28_001848 [Marasmius oreades]|uniref:Uncharacterized protein n=1 Tax=Marasmius oreades TaxID=181124 RepID=A0A9P8AFZ9_9AGAR|nr:uncharacterized protein E1B28_001848 [Marasmius oreades]KAG7100063.1 hypothetical protein E1B28_001848 [Marasmius oreades]
MSSTTTSASQSQSPTTTTNTFSVSSTFVDPLPSTSTTSDDGRGRGGNTQGSGATFGNTSASLYLYTFLATLVLLLGVSAAIILRSLLLRRRHRRMVEEAIRNGTWIPPTNSPRGGVKVDLSQKPKMWEAILGGGGYIDAKILDMHPLEKTKDPLEWSALKPISLQVLPLPQTQMNNDADTNAEVINDNNNVNNTETSISSRISQFLGWRSRPTTTVVNPVPARTRTAQDPSSDPTTSPSSPQTTPLLLIPPTQVRLSILVAMPSHHPVIPPLKPGEAVDGENLPCLEMGSVDLSIGGESGSTSTVAGEIGGCGSSTSSGETQR